MAGAGQRHGEGSMPEQYIEQSAFGTNVCSGQGCAGRQRLWTDPALQSLQQCAVHMCASQVCVLS